MNTVADMNIAERLGLERDCDQQAARAARGLVRRAVWARLQGDGESAVACDLDGSPLLVGPPGLGDGSLARRLNYTPEPPEPLVPTSPYGVTLTGHLEPMVEMPELGRYIARFCNRHARGPETLQEGGLELYHFAVTEASISRSDAAEQTLSAAEYLLEINDAPDHTQMEWDNLAHQNYQHLDINEQLVHALLERPSGRWVLTGLDPEGMDFRLGNHYCRLPFPAAAMTYRQMGEFIKIDLTEARTRLGVPLKKS